MYNMEYMTKLTNMRNTFVKNIMLIDKELKSGSPDTVKIEQY